MITGIFWVSRYCRLRLDMQVTRIRTTVRPMHFPKSSVGSVLPVA